MRTKHNKFTDLIAETYRILEESKKSREGAEKELAKISLSRFTAKKEAYSKNNSPNFGDSHLR